MGAVERAREAFERQAWREAMRWLDDAADGELSADDHERRAICAYLLGDDSTCTEAWESAYRQRRDTDAAGAARCAFWMALCLLLRGQMAQASGWLERARHLIDQRHLHCVAAGYTKIPALLGVLDDDPAAARDLAVAATAIGREFDDPDLVALGTLGHGQALIALEDRAGGLARLDEVMLSVTAGEVGPITSGIVYCAVILECMRLFDLPRAAEWTDALSAWCDAQPDLVPYRGQCLVHRSQLLQAAGQWTEAIETAERACRRLTDPPHPALGLAYYQEAELHRLVGSFDLAEAAYRASSQHGHHPMPGLALLQLTVGDVRGAEASISRALQEVTATADRPALLAAAVEIRRKVGDLAGARAAGAELATIAAGASSELLDAMADHAIGAVLISEGEPAAALTHLRRAATSWQSLSMPYEAARVAVLRGLACAAMGDSASAALEFDNARDSFTRLGAAPDVAHLNVLTGTAAARSAPLSTREREVLAHVAAGKTNREIAKELVISQHTVGRHVENIFTKLGVSSRAAATAYAYEHDLL